MLTDKEILGKIMIVAGVVLFFIGILSIGGSLYEQLILTISWLFGSILFVAGLVLELQLFAYSTTIGKIGAFFIFVSAVLMAIGLILFTFKEFSAIITNTVNVFLRGGVRPPNVYIKETRPYGWALIPLAQIAMVLFAVGLLLKLYDEFF